VTDMTRHERHDVTLARTTGSSRPARLGCRW
jgi:hypothetical protein